MRCTQLDRAKEVIRSSYSVLQGSQCCRERNSVALSHGIYTLHGNGAGTGTGNKWKVQCDVEMIILVGDRDQYPSFPIVPVLFPVLVSVLFLYSVNESLGLPRNRENRENTRNYLKPFEVCFSHRIKLQHWQFLSFKNERMCMDCCMLLLQLLAFAAKFEFIERWGGGGVTYQ